MAGTRLEIPALSKSRFIAGLQCLKRLYLECYARDLGGPPDEVTKAVFEAGSAIGALARFRYPAEGWLSRITCTMEGRRSLQYDE